LKSAYASADAGPLLDHPPDFFFSAIR